MRTAVAMIMSVIIGFGFGYMVQWDQAHRINKRNRALLLAEKHYHKITVILVKEILQRGKHDEELVTILDRYDDYGSSEEFLSELVEYRDRGEVRPSPAAKGEDADLSP